MTLRAASDNQSPEAFRSLGPSCEAPLIERSHALDENVRAGRDLLRRGFDAANRIGDLTFAAYCCSHLNTNKCT
jgi:hypothetical protein